MNPLVETTETATETNIHEEETIDLQCIGEHKVLQVMLWNKLYYITKLIIIILGREMEAQSNIQTKDIIQDDHSE